MSLTSGVEAVRALRQALGIDHVTVYDGQWPLDGGDDADNDCSIDTEQWDYENQRDPISPEEMRELQTSDPDRVASLYWIARKTVKRYRAATGRFMPRRRAKRGKARRRYNRKSGKPFGGKRRRGFYVEYIWITLEEVPEEVLESGFRKGGKRKGGSSRVKCFKSGKPGRFAADCTSKEQLCFNCHKPGHIAVQCPEALGHHLVWSVGPSYVLTLYIVLPGAPEDEGITRESQGDISVRAFPSAINYSEVNNNNNNNADLDIVLDIVSETQIEQGILIHSAQAIATIASSMQHGPMRHARPLSNAAAALAAELPTRYAAKFPPAPWPASQSSFNNPTTHPTIINKYKIILIIT